MADAVEAIPNIGRKHRLLRRLFGLASAALALALLGYMVAADLPRLARVAVVVPAWMAALGLLQDREKT